MLSFHCHLRCNFLSVTFEFRVTAYLVNHMSFVYSHRSRCDSFTLWFYGRVNKLIVSVPDIALLNFQVNKYLVYLDVCNFHSELK